ncbi:predicted protein [Nematostella vectensis]|uniref:Uncharacterized protein n=1 Tax=Nematostella vectensis TaxID=45351 RepID=A7TCW0_NEMVE|nr:predicted protein [Nematostella vectensis]|eukprot:XP_001618199.1 hypothetical protein NEMVEDRAFT_v1g225395 [Nematostella vectensis]
MAASRTNVRLQQNLYDAFLRHRRGDYDSLLDENLKCGGEKILEENDPKNKYRINVHSIFWMTAAMLVFYYTDFYIAIKVDDRINRVQTTMCTVYSRKAGRMRSGKSQANNMFCWKENN